MLTGFGVGLDVDLWNEEKVEGWISEEVKR